MTYPEISEQGITANPIDCQVYHRGETIPFCYVFTDNDELGKYNIEVKEAQNPWVFNQDFNIPDGQKSFSAREDIKIPTNIDTGDYHFMIRLTDKAGWQQIKSVAIKIVE